MAKVLRSTLRNRNAFLPLNRSLKSRFSTLSARFPHFFSTPANPANPTSVPFSHGGALPMTPKPSSNALSIPAFPCNKSAVFKLFKQQSALHKEKAFFVNDLGVVERQYDRWCAELPNVRPFYAVKCNPDSTLLRGLAGLGAGFDCASGAEMEAALATGVRPDEVIFANPIKNVSDLRFAHKHGVHKMTFDNEAELYKIKEHCPDAELVLRLLPDDSGSVMRFGVKFGAPYAHIEPLLRTAKKLDLKVIGTSFHIGSGCFDPQSYNKAIALCREVFDMADRLQMPRFTFLDLGGGFPGVPKELVSQHSNGAPSFEAFAAVIRDSLAQYFNPETHGHVQVIGEPGRYFATGFSTLFTLVQGKREEPVDPRNPNAPRKFLYYINDGVYGAFNCIMFDHAHPVPVPAYRFMSDRVSLDREKPVNATVAPSMVQVPSAVYAGLFNSMSSNSSQYAARGLHSGSARDTNCLATFFGPTCDSMDVIAQNTPMEELFVGDWLGFELMGAYTNAASTTFNGMHRAATYYVRSKQASPVINGA